MEWLNVSIGNMVSIKPFGDVEEQQTHWVRTYDGGRTTRIKCPEEGCDLCSIGLRPNSRYISKVIDKSDGREKMFSMGPQIYMGIRNCMMNPREDIKITGNEFFQVRREGESKLAKYSVNFDADTITFKKYEEPKASVPDYVVDENYDGRMSPYRVKKALKYFREVTTENINTFYGNLIQALHEDRCDKEWECVRLATRIRNL